MKTLTFHALRRGNDLRQEEWPGNEHADLAFRTIEVAGEVGELAEAVKKYLRSVRGIKGRTATLNDVADEMADAIISIDLLASNLSIDLGAAVVEKFNRTSKSHRMQTHLNPTFEIELGEGE